MEDYCKVIGKVWLVLGTIGSFILANVNGRVIEDVSMYGIEYKRNLPLTLGWFFGCMFAVLTIVVICHALAEIIETLDNVHYNTNNREEELENSVNYMRKLTAEGGNNPASKNGYWRCQKCGRENSFYTGTCACGELKP